jgi:hypothetical protein
MEKEKAVEALTAEEKRYLELAVGQRFEVRGLEYFSRLWDSIDERLGRDNELTGHFVEIYKDTPYEQPRDFQESRRVDTMRASFYLPRTGMPRDVITALIMSGMPGFNR